MMRAIMIAATAAFLAACDPQEAPIPFDFGAYDMVDLTHAYGADTVYWPTDKKGFSKKTVFEGMREDGWYAAFDIAAAEHGGTHMDAPYHFHERATRRTPCRFQG